MKTSKRGITKNKISNVTRHRKQFSYEDLSKHFERPIRDAAELIGISVSQLKRICREMVILVTINLTIFF